MGHLLRVPIVAQGTRLPTFQTVRSIEAGNMGIKSELHECVKDDSAFLGCPTFRLSRKRTFPPSWDHGRHFPGRIQRIYHPAYSTAASTRPLCIAGHLKDLIEQ
ncbi:uncharacterized protein LOC111865373 [Cryptotermes secundus]|uniref:uncharacterized protein LOC111865373 n=1 Tax=Cryptotermes secundus TaxID=105785 RepID=UPI000CD7AF78|nr:uncharacterized protein LOC111865373 [Cryptotermes secundus]